MKETSRLKEREQLLLKRIAAGRYYRRLKEKELEEARAAVARIPELEKAIADTCARLAYDDRCLQEEFRGARAERTFKAAALRDAIVRAEAELARMNAAERDAANRRGRSR